ncbi:hypothetical protein MS3_00000741 [Schistosoma haematobium]|uniref:Uncharacterized protein n=1 Tax=Schistosoma haematobium TaxID=6185 RepID=A0A922IKF0_SCHHA|nr:hypothetical protein MS3_00000741 [Schistosoma haematobium]KAH9580864.1 hypothetical protein MS3_00000741 [Schistosoma haematobium]
MFPEDNSKQPNQEQRQTKLYKKIDVNKQVQKLSKTVPSKKHSKLNNIQYRGFIQSNVFRSTVTAESIRNIEWSLVSDKCHAESTVLTNYIELVRKTIVQIV